MSAELPHEEALRIMTNFKRKLMAAGMACIVSAGAFAQKKEEKRPPKPDTRVVVEPKREKPPQNNNQGGDKKNDGKKGKG